MEQTRKATATATTATAVAAKNSGAGTAKPKKAKKEKPLTEKDLAKLAMADELGLMEKVRQEGWGALTGAESGRLGGLLSRRSREKRAASGTQPQD